MVNPNTNIKLILFIFFNMLHSLMVWLMVSSLSPHYLNLLFCCVLSVLGLIQFVLMMFYVAMRINLFSPLKDFSYEMLFINRFERP